VIKQKEKKCFSTHRRLGRAICSVHLISAPDQPGNTVLLFNEEPSLKVHIFLQCHCVKINPNLKILLAYNSRHSSLD
jgi:hypothetical protein